MKWIRVWGVDVECIGDGMGWEREREDEGDRD
jgi:hypothetical protein